MTEAPGRDGDIVLMLCGLVGGCVSVRLTVTEEAVFDLDCEASKAPLPLDLAEAALSLEHPGGGASQGCACRPFPEVALLGLLLARVSKCLVERPDLAGGSRLRERCNGRPYSSSLESAVTSGTTRSRPVAPVGGTTWAASPKRSSDR